MLMSESHISKTLARSAFLNEQGDRMKKTWQLDNIKCAGCVERIRQQLSQIASVEDLEVDLEKGSLSLDCLAEQEAVILARLKSLGYPLAGTTFGLSAVEADVRSVVSCAIGRLQANN